MLAKNPEKQKILRQYKEILFLQRWKNARSDAIPKGLVTRDPLRLYPVLSAIPRRPKQDIILGGYHISGGTAQVEFLLHQMGWDVTIFEDAEAFKPKRWLQTKDTALIETVEAFASLQFGLRTPFSLIALLKCSLLTENESGFHVATFTLH